MKDDTSPELYWRSLVLYGQNVATYKFALGKSLLTLAERPEARIHPDDLALEFSRHMVEHANSGKSQCTNSISSYLDACRAYGRGELALDVLINETKTRGFKYVLDAFQVLPSGRIVEPFYEIDGSGAKRSLRLTDNMYKLVQGSQFSNLTHEVEARWNLVEDTWTSNRGRLFDPVQYEIDTEMLIVETRSTYRRSLAKARDALSGYQKGKCFYCFSDIFVQDESSCEVDHFLPFHLRYKLPWDLNGVWNLVLACEACNRGPGTGKFGALPSRGLLDRLVRRNNYLVNSHHPLSNTLTIQTGITDDERRNFLITAYNFAAQYVRDIWTPANEFVFAF